MARRRTVWVSITLVMTVVFSFHYLHTIHIPHESIGSCLVGVTRRCRKECSIVSSMRHVKDGHSVPVDSDHLIRSHPIRSQCSRTIQVVYRVSLAKKDKAAVIVTTHVAVSTFLPPVFVPIVIAPWCRKILA